MSAASIQVQFSSQSLFDHLTQIQNDASTLMQFADTSLSILRDNLHNDRYPDMLVFYSTLPDNSGIIPGSLHRLNCCFDFSRVLIPFVKMLDLIITNGFFEIFTTQEK